VNQTKKYPYGEGEVPFDRPKTNAGLGLPRWFAVLDYFFLLRPMILLPVWLFLLLGHYHALDGLGVYSWTAQLLPDLDLIVVFIAYTLLVGGIYVNNQINDAETDRRNRKLFLLCDGYISLKKAWVYQGVLQLLALVSAIYFGRLEYLGIILLSIILGFLYNTPPFKLKGKPVLDILANGFGNGLLNVAVGYVVVWQLTGSFWLVSLPYILAVGAVFTNTTTADVKGDTATGERTTAVVFGQKAALWIALALMLASGVTAFFFQVWPALAGAVVSLPLFALALSGKKKWIKLSYMGATALYTLIAAGLFAWFLPFVVLVVLLTRYYYRKKFGMKYP